MLLAITFSLGNAPAVAEWTGVSVDIGEMTTDLQFETAQRTMRSDSLSLRIEENTATNLRVGFSIGVSNIRIANKVPPANAEKFEGGHLGIYLRWPVQLGEYFSLESLFTYQYNIATNSNTSLPNEIEWHDSRLQIGLGAKFQTLRVTPFIAYGKMRGDISNDTSAELFDSASSVSHGINFDYFIEPTAYIRFQLSRDGVDGGYLTFARVY
jgi:hypothetical protein